MSAQVVDLEARREAREATRAVGALTRELSESRRDLGGKADACIADVRALAAIQREQVTTVRRIDGTLEALVEAFRKLAAVEDATRRKLESFADLDAVTLGNMSLREAAKRRRWRNVKKWLNRGALAALVGAAGVIGATGGYYALRALHVTPAPVEVAP